MFTLRNESNNYSLIIVLFRFRKCSSIVFCFSFFFLVFSACIVLAGSFQEPITI